MPFQHLREKLAPEVEGRSGGTPTEDANKVILESLDGFFSHVATMVVGENKFECHAQCVNGFLVRHQFLIVQDCSVFDVWGRCLLFACVPGLVIVQE